MEIEENVIKLCVEVGKQSVQIKNLNEKVDNISDDVKEIKKSLTYDVKTSNKWMRSTIVKLIGVVVAAGGAGAGVSSLISAFGG